MCGRYSIRKNRLQDRIFGNRPVYKTTPGTQLPVIDAEHRNRALEARWGFLPDWLVGKRSPFINARGETVHQLPSFRSAFRRHRCLVPADGFYEPQPVEGGRKREWFFHAPDDDIFWMAGIIHYPKDDRPPGFAIITCAAPATITDEAGRPIHNRLPVIISQANTDAWLDAGADQDTLRGMLTPPPPGGLEYWEVQRGAQGPAAIEPLRPL